MDPIVKEYRNQIMRAAQQYHWIVQEDPAPDDRDARLTIRHGVSSCPMLLYHTGKIVVQGKASPLRDTLIDMGHQLKAGEQLSDVPMGMPDPDEAIQELHQLSALLPTLDSLAAQLAAEAAVTYQHQAC